MTQDERCRYDGFHGTTKSTAGLARPLAEAAVPCLTILCHPDPDRVGEIAPLTCLLSGESQLVSRLEPRFFQRRSGMPRPLADGFLSRKPFCLAPGEDDGVVLSSTTAGTSLLANGRPIKDPIELGSAELARGMVLLLRNRVTLLLHTTGSFSAAKTDHGLIGESAGIERVHREIEQVADLSCPVLLQGESGTGKELVAEALHEAGPRRDKPFVTINIGAIPPDLAAAELFGTGPGAFTGATRRLGYFRQAAGGTLFLDEIAKAPPELQAMLLRVLENGEIQPVGAEQPHPVDVRIVSATDVNLEVATAAGEFAGPLFHRLSSFEISLPPLRERREDFRRLFFHILGQELDALGEKERLAAPDGDVRPLVPAPLISRLALLQWLGNVRQLQNVVRRLAIKSRGEPELQPDSKVEQLLRQTVPEGKAGRTSYRVPSEVSELELIAALDDHSWNVKLAARQLNLSRTSLYALINAHPGLRKAADVSRKEIIDCAARCSGKIDAMAEELEVSKRGLQLRMKALDLRI